MSGPRFVAYETGGGCEWLLGYGPGSGPQLLILQPLFEEMNRTRAILAELQRRLANAGVGSWLADLPGTGESGREIATVRWQDWREAVREAASAGAATAVAAFRGGCLLDGEPGLPRWRLSPQDGARALRDLTRATGDARVPAWPLSADLEARIAEANASGGARVIRLASDPSPADGRIAAAPPWRRAEPARDDVLTAAIAADIVAWLAA